MLSRCKNKWNTWANCIFSTPVTICLANSAFRPTECISNVTDHFHNWLIYAPTSHGLSIQKWIDFRAGDNCAGDKRMSHQTDNAKHLLQATTFGAVQWNSHIPTTTKLEYRTTFFFLNLAFKKEELPAREITTVIFVHFTTPLLFLNWSGSSAMIGA